MRIAPRLDSSPLPVERGSGICCGVAAVSSQKTVAVVLVDPVTRDGHGSRVSMIAGQRVSESGSHGTAKPPSHWRSGWLGLLDMLIMTVITTMRSDASRRVVDLHPRAAFGPAAAATEMRHRQAQERATGMPLIYHRTESWHQPWTSVHLSAAVQQQAMPRELTCG